MEGYKTDPRDAERIAVLLQRGLLRGSYVPSREIRHLRMLTRTRVHLMEEITRVKNRISQLCETGNIKVSSMATDLFGCSGRTILKSPVEGQHDRADGRVCAGCVAQKTAGVTVGLGRNLE